MSDTRARILEARARALARPLAETEAAGDDQFLMFTLAGERYALALGFVQEVCTLLPISVLPGAEPPVSGVVAWRGQLLMVIDLALLLGVQAPTTMHSLVVAGADHGEFAIAVEAVSGIRTIDITRLHKVAGAVERDCVLGLTADAEVVLDSSQLRLYI